ncbi:hypothetical protein Nepgr_011930 [Nepenthes gracilis]|uniref:PLAC8 family protein n=1 Tax=Nepenthes gracilis TaxID=150966 RepID=A0AAD3SG15_NEPGR|nr:hypothetical protein Nepgr_011930 [Nepenthes gracilis]
MVNNSEESSSLLENQESVDKDAKVVEEFEKKNNYNSSPLPPPVLPEKSPQAPPPQLTPLVAESNGWTANGFPLGVVGDPVGRTQWNSSLISCLGRQDEFWDSDLEVCVLGTVAPCVLYGSNVARLGSAPETFTSNCMNYNALYLIGNYIFGWNCLAPWFSSRSRTALRRRFNLEGNLEAFSRTCGCCRTCDLATHVFCHPCSLCQEGREIRRRLPHPAFHPQPILVMIPPSEQTMGRDAAA